MENNKDNKTNQEQGMSETLFNVLELIKKDFKETRKSFIINSFMVASLVSSMIISITESKWLLLYWQLVCLVFFSIAIMFERRSNYWSSKYLELLKDFNRVLIGVSEVAESLNEITKVLNDTETDKKEVAKSKKKKNEK